MSAIDERSVTTEPEDTDYSADRGDFDASDSTSGDGSGDSGCGDGGDFGGGDFGDDSSDGGDF